MVNGHNWIIAVIVGVIIATPIVLKACHVLPCSWYVALIPLWIALGIVVIPLLFIAILGLIIHLKQRKCICKNTV